MGTDSVPIDAVLVERLLAGQAPRWSGESLRRVDSSGTDNVLFRCGDPWVVRLPRVSWAALQPGTEARWLPHIASRVPLPVPVPVFVGEPANGYPYDWTVVPWLPGSNPGDDAAEDLELASALAAFLTALRAVPAAGGPAPGPANSGRGAPLATRDAAVREAIERMGPTIDRREALARWETALSAPVHESQGVWIHGDLHAGNLIVREGRLVGVVDFGCMAVGDPACDLIPAWNLFDPPARERFRREMEPDDAAWERGRGWALSVAVIALPFYQDTNPVIVAHSRRTLARLGVRVY